MALSAAQLKLVMRSLATTMSQTAPVRYTKADLVAAATAADAWATANAASYVTALGTFGSTSTAQEKALLLAYVCLMRAGMLT